MFKIALTLPTSSANFPSVEPAQKTPFSLYSRKPGTGGDAGMLDSGFFHAATDTVEFTSITNDFEPDPGHSSR